MNCQISGAKNRFSDLDLKRDSTAMRDINRQEPVLQKKHDVAADTDDYPVKDILA